MKIYFAASIRGGREDQALYYQLIQHLNKYGEVLTGHVGDKTIDALGEKRLTNKYIFFRDMAWMREADVVVAEVSTPSLGVGYELKVAEELHKRILCLYREAKDKSLSPMISGNPHFVVKNYKTTDEGLGLIDAFLVGE